MMAANLAKRTLSTSALLRTTQKMSSKADFLKPHHSGGMKLWRNMTFFVAIPACAILSVNVYLQHQKEHECHKRKEYIPYDHLNIRTKRFPWGDGNHSFFFNKHANALPTGYEDDDEEH